MQETLKAHVLKPIDTQQSENSDLEIIWNTESNIYPQDGGLH